MISCKLQCGPRDRQTFTEILSAGKWVLFTCHMWTCGEHVGEDVSSPFVGAFQVFPQKIFQWLLCDVNEKRFCYFERAGVGRGADLNLWFSALTSTPGKEEEYNNSPTWGWEWVWWHDQNKHSHGYQPSTSVLSPALSCRLKWIFFATGHRSPLDPTTWYPGRLREVGKGRMSSGCGKWLWDHYQEN